MTNLYFKRGEIMSLIKRHPDLGMLIGYVLCPVIALIVLSLGLSNTGLDPFSGIILTVLVVVLGIRAARIGEAEDNRLAQEKARELVTSCAEKLRYIHGQERSDEFLRAVEMEKPDNPRWVDSLYHRWLGPVPSE